jgi:CDGSH-type Zn-finger protein
MRLSVNGADVEVDDRQAKTPLPWVLRDVLGMPGTKFGCGAGLCTVCTVLIDGRNTKSCQTERAVGKTENAGPVRLTDPDGRVIEHPDPMAMCRCGHSGNKPFCDGTHATIDFDGTLAN